jgi:hypothetical protein
MCSSAPDTSGVNAAAKANSDTAKEALDWYKSAYNDQAPLRQQAADTAKRVSDAQIEAMGTQTRLANETDAYNKSTFRPLEQRIVSDAQGYDTVDRQDQAAGRAAGDIELAAAGARAGGERSLERSGVNPSDGAFAALQGSTDIGLALGKADAMNRARELVRSTGRAMRMDAASLGRGLPSQQATQTSLALNAGNAAAGTAQIPVSLAQQGTDQVGRGMSLAGNLNSSSGNLYGTAAGIEAKAGDDSGMWQGIGSAVGGIAIAV